MISVLVVVVVLWCVKVLINWSWIVFGVMFICWIKIFIYMKSGCFICWFVIIVNIWFVLLFVWLKFILNVKMVWWCIILSVVLVVKIVFVIVFMVCCVLMKRCVKWKNVVCVMSVLILV